MSFRHWAASSCRALFALAACAPALAGEPHNLVLLVPEALPAASVEHGATPTLARLRAEGAYFINSYSGFPRLVTSEPSVPPTHLDVQALLRAADAAEYSIALNLRPRPTSPGSTERSLETALPKFKESNRPFVAVYHLEARAPPRVVDEALATIEELLKEQGLYESTNIIVSAQSGLSTIWKESRTSRSLKPMYVGKPREKLPPGFLAIDLATALQEDIPSLSLFDPDDDNRIVDWGLGEHPKRGNAIIASDPVDPYVKIEAKGGHSLIYLPDHLSKREARHLALVLVEVLLMQDYVSGLFVDEGQVGSVRGALSMKHIGWHGGAGTRLPAIAVNFVSVSMGCERPTACTAVIADTPLEDGQEIPGAFSRADTWSFLAARGPDFQSRLISRPPASPADIVRTIGRLLRLEVGPERASDSRLLLESLRGNEGKEAPRVRKDVVVSKASDGLMTEVHLQWVGSTRYFVAAGAPGWTVGVPHRDEAVGWRFWKWEWPRPRSFTIEITPD